MRSLQALSLALGVATATLGVHGLNIPIKKRAMAHSTSVRMSTPSTDNDPFGFQNVGNGLYTGVIEVSGKPFVVCMQRGFQAQAHNELNCCTIYRSKLTQALPTCG